MEIRVEQLSVGYAGKPVQRAVDFTVRAGEIFAIMGGSGCGKSTVLKAMIGLLRPLSGRILYGETVFAPATTQAQAPLQERIGVLYQQGALWSSMTIGENIALPLKFHTRLKERAIRALIEYKLALVGLSGVADKLPAELSGGMRKRAALARALALDPEVLFLDEPQAGLDPVSSARLDALILQLRDSLGTTVVMVTHELASLFAVVDRAIYLDKVTGQPSGMGDPRAMRDTPPNAEIGAFLNRQ